MKETTLFNNNDPDKSVYGETNDLSMDTVFTVLKYLHSNDYKFKRLEGYDYLNLNRKDFEIGSFNIIRDLFNTKEENSIYGFPIPIKKPHSIKRGDIINIDTTTKEVKR